MFRTMRLMGGLLAALALAACGQPAAADAMLFEAAGWVPVADEASLLSSQARELVRVRREDRFTKQVMVVRFNARALQSSRISLEMPDHRAYHFAGVLAPAVGVRGYFTWRGSATPAAASDGAATAAAPGHGAFLGNALEFFFDSGPKYVQGTLTIDRRSFQLTSLDGGYMAVQENGLNPSSPPIDAEPTGPQRRPPANPDWPRGVLTEKLRASLATAPIGAWIAPDSCNRVTTCGEVTKISCTSTSDGPEMYFNNMTGKLVMACGGACMRGPGLPGSKLCTACPPPEWKACTGAGR